MNNSSIVCIQFCICIFLQDDGGVICIVFPTCSRGDGFLHHVHIFSECRWELILTIWKFNFLFCLVYLVVMHCLTICFFLFTPYYAVLDLPSGSGAMSEIDRFTNTNQPDMHSFFFFFLKLLILWLNKIPLIYMYSTLFSFNNFINREKNKWDSIFSLNITPKFWWEKIKIQLWIRSLKSRPEDALFCNLPMYTCRKHLRKIGPFSFSQDWKHHNIEAFLKDHYIQTRIRTFIFFATHLLWMFKFRIFNYLLTGALLSEYSKLFRYTNIQHYSREK